MGLPLSSKLSNPEQRAIAILCDRTGEKDPFRAIIARSDRLVREFGGNSYQTPARLAHAQRIIEIAKLDLTFDACLLPVAQGFRVEVCRFHSTARQNFSIAHEIGHTFLIELNPALGSPKRETGIGDGLGTNLIEQLCDRAAAELLWPAARFISDAWELGPSMRSVLELATRYGTSVTATARRFAEVGLWKCHFVTWEATSNSRNEASLRPRAVYRGPFVAPIYKQDLVAMPDSLFLTALKTKEIVVGREFVTNDEERCYTESVRLGRGEDAQVLSLLLVSPTQNTWR